MGIWPLETKKIAELASCSPNAGARPYLKLLTKETRAELSEKIGNDNTSFERDIRVGQMTRFTTVLDQSRSNSLHETSI